MLIFYHIAAQTTTKPGAPYSYPIHEFERDRCDLFCELCVASSSGMSFTIKSFGYLTAGGAEGAQGVKNKTLRSLCPCGEKFIFAKFPYLDSASSASLR
jgi:hypothetical protein